MTKKQTKRQAKRILGIIIALTVILGILLMMTLLLMKEMKADRENDKNETTEAIAWVETTDGITDVITTEAVSTTEEPTESPEEIVNRELEELVAHMTLEEKVGQMFFIRADASFDQTTFDTYHPGGILLFGQDVENKTVSQLRDYIGSFQRYSTYPLFIGIDEEGGTVTRVSHNSNLVEEAFESPRNLYEQGGFEAVIEDSHKKSSLLKSFGINVNFAPVVDYSVDYGDFMYQRAFGNNIEETCEFAEKIVFAMKEDQMGCVLKHFPGYGNNGDTHTNIITDYREYDIFVEQDFLPFQSGIEAGADSVLVSHNIVVSMDETYPASLSENVHRILREDLGFEGVIITDDLAMSGVADFVSVDAAAVQAVKAGNDMMIVSDYAVQYDAVVAAVQNGELDIQKIDESVIRILRWKYNLGLLEDLGTY
ncbi:MAG: beta-hexosaminidase [Coprococcus sp.]|nr:beta-hexosaminidase [Coprococcus sp.]